MKNGIIYTSLAQIKSFDPCASGWHNILRARKPSDREASRTEQFPLVDCLNSNSVADVLWLLRNRNQLEHKAFITAAARGFAGSVAYLRNDDAAAAADVAAANAVYAAAEAAVAAVANAAAVYAAAVYAAAADAAADSAAVAVVAAAAAAAAAAYAQPIKNKQILRDVILHWEDAERS